MSNCYFDCDTSINLTSNDDVNSICNKHVEDLKTFIVMQKNDYARICDCLMAHLFDSNYNNVSTVHTRNLLFEKAVQQTRNCHELELKKLVDLNESKINSFKKKADENSYNISCLKKQVTSLEETKKADKEFYEKKIAKLESVLNERCVWHEETIADIKDEYEERLTLYRSGHPVMILGFDPLLKISVFDQDEKAFVPNFINIENFFGANRTNGGVVLELEKTHPSRFITISFKDVYNISPKKENGFVIIHKKNCLTEIVVRCAFLVVKSSRLAYAVEIEEFSSNESTFALYVKAVCMSIREFSKKDVHPYSDIQMCRNILNVVDKEFCMNMSVEDRLCYIAKVYYIVMVLSLI